MTANTFIKRTVKAVAAVTLMAFTLTVIGSALAVVITPTLLMNQVISA